MYVNTENVKYFGNFGVEHTPNEITKIIENENFITSLYRIQAYDSIICVYFCIRFIDFMLKSKNLLDNINLFSPNEYKKMEK